MSSTEYEAIQTEAKQRRSNDRHCSSDQREPVNISSDREGGLPEIIMANGCLRLTVPHLSNCKNDHPKRDEESVFVAGSRSGNNDGDACKGKRNSPLSVIANFLGIHCETPSVEFRIHLHFDEDGRMTQVVSLPKGWRYTPLPMRSREAAQSFGDEKRNTTKINTAKVRVTHVVEDFVDNAKRFVILTDGPNGSSYETDEQTIEKFKIRADSLMVVRDGTRIIGTIADDGLFCC